MKKMTCREMGGVCDAEIQGETAEEMGGNGKKHVHESTDEAHRELCEKMKTISDEEMAAWKKDFETKFAAAPDA